MGPDQAADQGAAIGSVAVTDQLSGDTLLWAAVAVLTVGALLGAVLLWRDRARLRRELAVSRHDVDHLRQRVDGLVAARAHRTEVHEFVITDLGDPGPEETPPEAPALIDGRMFADIVLRETVVKAAALTHGVRRALAPEVVWRVRGEIRRELKRARRQRRADLKAARRAWEGAT